MEKCVVCETAAATFRETRVFVLPATCLKYDRDADATPPPYWLVSCMRLFARIYFVQFEKLGRNLIQIRQRFHPLQVKELVVAMAALVFHTVLQLWLYLTGRWAIC